MHYAELIDLKVLHGAAGVHGEAVVVEQKKTHLVPSQFLITIAAQSSFAQLAMHFLPFPSINAPEQVAEHVDPLRQVPLAHSQSVVDEYLKTNPALHVHVTPSSELANDPQVIAAILLIFEQQNSSFSTKQFRQALHEPSEQTASFISAQEFAHKFPVEESFNSHLQVPFYFVNFFGHGMKSFSRER
ncbi:Hypothetical_protein [Hexamita inflata]|uniref:Hypothetical_protein n=1 Tax=Hexamita inflata TaxID=28002 RepID=A0AA86PDP5_9EUKA|nr:Hypothetical protein HINF_LOCUS24741 [Hexamita inflata]